MQLTAREQPTPDETVPADERARKRQAIGLSAARPTAKDVIFQPPVERENGPLVWLAVLLLVGMLAITAWLLLRNLQPDLVGAARSGPSTLLLQDDFVQPVLGLSPEVVTQNWSMGYVGDLYQIRIDQPGVLAWTTLGQIDLGGYRFESAQMLTGSAGDNSAWGYAGLLVRYQNDQNFYIFVVDGRGKYQVQVQEQGNWRTLQPWTDSAVLAPVGGENVLSVEDDGRSLRFYVGAELLFTLDDLRLPVGDVGFLAGSRSQGTAQVLYDWVRVRAIPIAR